MKIESVFFTVFTPVFNRRHTINRVWESLIKQTYNQFEWIVIDDGSTDGVIELLEEYKRKAPFCMTVIRQENRGKHIAWNRAVTIARGELFVPADSDDAFVPETLELFNKWWLSIDPIERTEFSGINVLCKDFHTGEIIGDKFPGDRFISNNLELTYKYKISGEKWGCLRTDLLRIRPFPEVSRGLGFFPEVYVFYWLAHRFKVLCINQPLRFYEQTGADRVSTVKSRKEKGALNNYLFLKYHINENLIYILRYGYFIEVLKNFLRFWRDGFLSGKSLFEITRSLQPGLQQIMGILALPLGFLIYKMTQFKEK